MLTSSSSNTCKVQDTNSNKLSCHVDFYGYIVLSGKKSFKTAIQRLKNKWCLYVHCLVRKKKLVAFAVVQVNFDEFILKQHHHLRFSVNPSRSNFNGPLIIVLFVWILYRIDSCLHDEFLNAQIS